MDFTTDEELDGYLVLILFMLKKKKTLALKKTPRFWIQEIFIKTATDRLYKNLVH